MSSVKQFEDLICWQEGRKLVNLIYPLTRQKKFFDFSLKNQIQRAAVSIISNIAEGFERGSKEEFIYFLYIAKGSCGELRTQLYLALDQGFINRQEFESILPLCQRVSAMIYRLIESLKGSQFKGLKYKHNEKKDPLKELLLGKYPKIYRKLYNKSS